MWQAMEVSNLLCILLHWKKFKSRFNAFLKSDEWLQAVFRNSWGLLITSERSVKVTEKSMFMYTILQTTELICSWFCGYWKVITENISLQGLIQGSTVTSVVGGKASGDSDPIPPVYNLWMIWEGAEVQEVVWRNISRLLKAYLSRWM